MPGHSRVLIKRDDLSGFGRGGVKTRKIEHLIGHMQRHGHRGFVTVLANITNLGHDIVPALAKFGIEASVLVVDEPRLAPELRKAAFAGIGPEVRLLGPSRVLAAVRMVRAARELSKRHARPLIVLPGLMHPAGVVGNACGFLEMASQFRDTRRELPHSVYITVSSGTTLAGFLIAEQALRREGGTPIRIVGVQVYPGLAKGRILGLIRWTERFLGLEGRVPAERVEIVASELCLGFGSYSPEHARMCSTLAADSGVTVDPIFGGKTWAVMASRMPDEAGDRPVLYWHCGYTPDWPIVGQAACK